MNLRDDGGLEEVEISCALVITGKDRDEFGALLLRAYIDYGLFYIDRRDISPPYLSSQKRTRAQIPLTVNCLPNILFKIGAIIRHIRTAGL